LILWAQVGCAPFHCLCLPPSELPLLFFRIWSTCGILFVLTGELVVLVPRSLRLPENWFHRPKSSREGISFPVVVRLSNQQLLPFLSGWLCSPRRREDQSTWRDLPPRRQVILVTISSFPLLVSNLALLPRQRLVQVSNVSPGPAVIPSLVPPGSFEIGRSERDEP